MKYAWIDTQRQAFGLPEMGEVPIYIYDYDRPRATLGGMTPKQQLGMVAKLDLRYPPNKNGELPSKIGRPATNFK